MKKILFAIFLIFTCHTLFAQGDSSIHFTITKKRVNESLIELIIKAKIDKGTTLFALHRNDSALVSTTISFDSSVSNKLKGSLIEKGVVVTGKDPVLKTPVNSIIDSVEWHQQINAALKDSFVLKGVISYSYKKGEEYLSGEEPVKVYFEPVSNGSESSIANRSLLWIFIAAFGGGLLALLTPCVYSMIPVTVSFFTKRSKTKAQGKRNAISYAASIVIIFTLLGFLITLIFGPAALNNLSTNWIANLLFFALFLVFGISFLGAFEIALPSSWSTRVDSKAGMGSFAGIFFMALTLVLVSFSCTGPIIGNLLVLASKGNYYGPLVGMFGFSLALALPFALFAFFPSKLNILGKAGGWLNAVKVTLGFLELALALKFLSNADLSKGWRLLDREVFISLWVVIFFLLGVYLLGKLKFHHDDELPKNDFGLPYLSVTRLLFAIAAFTFAVYLVPGLWGAPLKSVSAFVPPMGTQDFNSSAVNNFHAVSSANDGVAHPVKYVDRMKIYEPEVVTKYGMVTYFDYGEALLVAKNYINHSCLTLQGLIV